jgi:dephospho-CoA kinase
MTIIAICGVQGSGKSTLIEDIRETKKLRIDDFKVSRTVTKEMGFSSLLEAVATTASMIKFQESVFEKKYAHDMNLAKDYDQLWIVERSFIDIAVYTKIWIAELEEKGLIEGVVAFSWFKQYVNKCLEAQAQIYDGVVRLEKLKGVKFEKCAYRASEESRVLVESVFDETVENLEHNMIKLSVNDRQIRRDTVICFANSVHRAKNLL